MIDLAIQNNATFNFDNTIDPANSLNFDNVEELQNYLNNFNNSVAINLETEDNGNNTKTSRFKFDLGMFAYLNVSVKQKLHSLVFGASAGFSLFSLLINLTKTKRAKATITKLKIIPKKLP